MTDLLSLLVLYYAIAVLMYWLPLLALRWRSARALPPDPDPQRLLPLLIVAVPCRAAPAAIPGLAACMAKQDYPPGRHRTIVVIDSTDDADPSAEAAYAAGIEVYERRNAEVRTKGAAINELLANYLEKEEWDAILVLDVDSRVDPHFLTRTAAYLNRGSKVIQAAPQSRDLEDTPVARINHAAQVLSQLVQRGRAALGWSAILSGAGMVFSRESIVRLRWHFTTGRHVSDDGELNFRCRLANLPITYAPDLKVRNDLPADLRASRFQRSRWFAAYVEGLPYVWPMLEKGVGSADWRTLEELFTLMFLPGCSLSFGLAGVALIGLGLASLFNSGYFSLFWKLGVLWGLHVLYYREAFRRMGVVLSREDFKHLPDFLGVRWRALWEGTLLGAKRNPGQHSVPSEHLAASLPTGQAGAAAESASEGSREHA